MATNYVYNTVLFLVLARVTAAVLDLTCLGISPRIEINGDNNHFIGAFKSGPNARATVDFGRVIDTGTGEGLPNLHQIKGHTSTPAKILYLPQVLGKRRVGVFYCKAKQNGDMEMIPIIIMAFTKSDIIPVNTYQTVNSGDSATLAVHKQVNISLLRWRHNGQEERPEWDGMNSVTIHNLSNSDGGFYECYSQGERNKGVHAIFQLLVRGCPANKFGARGCVYDCPICLNGGICHEQHGICICAPGFTGRNCGQVLGSNRFGQDGHMQCSRKDGNDPHSRACQGTILCLPYPYGCSCASRYHGIDCMTECPTGFYGPDCKQECHCAAGVACLDDTGECLGGRCLAGWSGVNCQHADQIINIAPIPQGNISFIFDWEPELSPCLQKEYLMEYELSNFDQCDTRTGESLKKAGTVIDTDFSIEGLLYHSSYIFYVTTVHNGTYKGKRSAGVTVHTGEAVPSQPPTEVSIIDVTSKILSFEWSAPPCGSRRGRIMSYLYLLTDERHQEMVANGTTASYMTTFADLTPFSNYRFEVAAVTSAGVGPLSEPVYITTNQTAPGAPISLQVESASKYSITVAWTEPTHQHYKVEKYYVSSKAILKPYNRAFRGKSEQAHGQIIYNKERHIFTNLKPTTRYEIKVYAYSDTGRGGHSLVRAFTLPASSEDISTPEKLLPIDGNQVTHTTVFITIPQSSAEFITGYQVGVEWLPTIKRKKRQSARGQSVGHYMDPRFHVAAELSKDTVRRDPNFVIGDNKTYGMFFNGPLMENQKYKIYTAFVSRIDMRTFAASWSDGTPVSTNLQKASKQTNINLESQSKGTKTETIVIIFLVVVIVIIGVAFLVLLFKTRPPGSKVMVAWNRLSDAS